MLGNERMKDEAALFIHAKVFDTFHLDGFHSDLYDTKLDQNRFKH